MGETEGFAKVIADASTDEVLGVHLIGPAVTDLIAEAALGMTLEATAWEIGAATHPHPDSGRGHGRGGDGRLGPPDQRLALPARRRGYLDRFATQPRIASATSSQPGAAMSQWVRSGNSSSSVTAGEWRYLR